MNHGNRVAGSAAIGEPMILAYRETDYQVRGETSMTLRIGQASAALVRLHEAASVNASAFITACNPLSRPLDDAQNAVRQAALADDLRGRGLSFVDGLGQHPTGDWPGEPSYLVLGVSLDVARELGVRHEQNAIVWSGADAVPQLILLR